MTELYDPMAPTIGPFQGPRRWLSNFAPVAVEWRGMDFPSVEHAYQAAKACDGDDLHLTACAWAHTPAQAKRLGREVTIRPGWNADRNAVMLALLQQKFQQSPYSENLYATGYCRIVEFNNWGDRYWGVCNGEGKNWLGHLIMLVRHEIFNNCDHPRWEA